MKSGPTGKAALVLIVIMAGGGCETVGDVRDVRDISDDVPLDPLRPEPSLDVCGVSNNPPTCARDARYRNCLRGCWVHPLMPRDKIDACDDRCQEVEPLPPIPPEDRMWRPAPPPPLPPPPPPRRPPAGGERRAACGRGWSSHG